MNEQKLNSSLIIENGVLIRAADKSIVSVEIPDTVTSVGNGAFLGCESLQSVTIPDGVTSIGEAAFDDCSKDLVIHCAKNSCAEEYAAKHGIKAEKSHPSIYREMLSPDEAADNPVGIPSNAITEEEFLALRGYGSPVSNYSIDKFGGANQTRLSEAQREDTRNKAQAAEQKYAQERAAVRAEYKALVESGKIRDKTEIEKTLTKANGNGDREDVRAARRMAEKRGYDWKTGEKLKQAESAEPGKLKIKQISSDDRTSELENIRAQIKNMRGNKISQKEIVDYVCEQSEKYKPTVDEYREMLDFRAKFYNYSFCNNIMIYMQNPHSSYVGSFDHFRKLGYPVRKGERGMIVRVPKPVTLAKIGDEWQNVSKLPPEKQADVKCGKYEVRQKMYFGTGYVFDISQTSISQEQLPELLRSMSPKINSEEYYNALTETVKEHGVTIQEKDLKSITLHGYYRPSDDSITINSQLPASDKLNTLAHEFSHALLHHNLGNEELSAAQIEFEAESSAYIALKQAGFDMSDYKFRYTASHLKNMSPDELQKAMQRIDKCSKYICTQLSEKIGIDLNRRQIVRENDSLTCRHVSAGHCANQDNSDEPAHHERNKAVPKTSPAQMIR